MKINFSSLFLLIIINLCTLLCFNTDNNINSIKYELKIDKKYLGKKLIYENYKYHNESILFNTPRKDGTLNYTLAKYDEETKKYIPFPNVEFNNYTEGIKSCHNFISVVDFEIDDDNDIYALDEGSGKCSAKLYKLDMRNNIPKEYGYFDLNIFVKKENITLNNFVIDKINNYAYIIYTQVKNNIYSHRILGIDLENNQTKINKEIKIGFDEKYNIPSDLKKNLSSYISDFDKKLISISLSCDAEALFISPFVNRKIYSISTKDLMEEKDDIQINEAYKNDASSSLITSNMGNLYFSGIEQNVIYIIAQIDNDLSEFDYRSFGKIEIDEDISYISKISLANGVLYLTAKTFLNDGNFKSELIKIEIEEGNSYEKSYMNRCSGLIYKYDWKSYSVWIIFCLIVIFIVVFVLVENKQDFDNNKKEN